MALVAVMAAVAGLNTALSDIGRQLRASQTELTWIVDAYSVVFAGLLLFCGALGDRFGRRTALVVGLGVFGCASGLAALASSPVGLIAARTVMGAAAALVMPATLAVITNEFPPGERERAVGLWAGFASGGGALGLFASGLLLEVFNWPSVFVLNALLSAVALTGVVLVVPPSRPAGPARLDLPGGALSVAGLSVFVYGIIEAGSRGWSSAATVVALAAGGVLCAAFVVWELHTERPLLDPRLFGSRPLWTGSLSVTVQFFAALGLFYVLLVYLQFIRGFSPLATAAGILPMAVVMVPLSAMAPKVVERLGARLTGAGGLLVMAMGLAALSTLGPSSSYLRAAFGLALMAAGTSLAAPPATAAIVAALPRSQQGVASAINDTARELGGALGIALLGSVMSGVYANRLGAHFVSLPPGTVRTARGSLQGAIRAALRLGAHGHALLESARQSFADGVDVAFLVAAVVLLLGALAMLVFSPNSRERPQGGLGADDQPPT